MRLGPLLGLTVSVGALGLYAADVKVIIAPTPCSIPLLRAQERAHTKIRTVEPPQPAAPIREVTPPAPPCDEPSALPPAWAAAPDVTVKPFPLQLPNNWWQRFKRIEPPPASDPKPGEKGPDLDQQELPPK